MFSCEFEKTAKFNLKDASKPIVYLGKSIGHGLKGVGEGLAFQAKRSGEKFKTEVPKLKKGWKGFKNPESYGAVTKGLAKFTPEILTAGAAAYVADKAMSIEERGQSVPLAYY